MHNLGNAPQAQAVMDEMLRNWGTGNRPAIRASALGRSFSCACQRDWQRAFANLRQFVTLAERMEARSFLADGLVYGRKRILPAVKQMIWAQAS